MKNKLYITLLTVPFMLMSFSVKPSLTDANNLGIFKDLNKEEVKQYYSSITDNNKGDALVLELEAILKNNHTKLNKSSVGSSWDYFVLLDRDWTKDPLTQDEINSQEWKVDNVICNPLYDTEFTFVSSQNPGNKVNREHVFPKSYGFATSANYTAYASTDMHNLHMGEARGNQQGHNNYPYGNVASKDNSSAILSSISGNVCGYLGLNKNGISVFEPLDDEKGDIARSIFYMATRYHTYDSTLPNNPALRLSNSPDSPTGSVACEATATKPCTYGILSDLLLWNKADPVDDVEIHRNNLCYNAVQKNRNPFIDYPSWVDLCFDKTISNKGVKKDANPAQIGETFVADYNVVEDDPIFPIDPIDPVDPEDPTEPENPVVFGCGGEILTFVPVTLGAMLTLVFLLKRKMGQ